MRSAARPLAGKRVGLLTAWASRANAGVFEAVVRQVELLRDAGAVPVVIAVDDPDHAQDRWRLAAAEVCLAEGRGPSQLAYAPRLTRTLLDANLDLLHLHGVWQFPTHAAGRWARRTGRPLIISPHGMFDPWITTRNRWKKVLGTVLWERRGWQAARHFHALTAEEGRDIARMMGGQVPTTVIANPAPNPAAQPHRNRPPMALYLGRIHEKKNLVALVDGWHMALPDLPEGALLTIAGWGDDAGIAALEDAIAAKGGLSDSVEFVGTAFGSQKAALFDVARFCVLPSLSEGLPMVVLEAWAAGTPVIMTRHCNLPEGFAAGAALECGTDVGSIADALRTGFALGPAEWDAMAQAGIALATGTFGADAVGAAWADLYRALMTPDAATASTA